MRHTQLPILHLALAAALTLSACGRDYSGPASGVVDDDTGSDTGGADITSPDTGFDTSEPDAFPDTDPPPDVGPMPDTTPDAPPDPDIGPPERFYLEITPGTAEVIAGETAQFRALWIGEDSTEDVTAQAQWFIATAQVQLVAPGRFRTLATNPGQWTVTAQFEDGEADAELIVNSAAENLVDIAIQPASIEVPDGFDGQVRALGLYDNGTSRDLTTLVDWESRAADVFSVRSGDDGGLISSVGPGRGQVTAELNGVLGVGDVTVIAAELEAIEIVPRAVTIPIDDQTQLQALGQFSNGELLDITAQVTWTSDDSNIAAFSRGVPGNVAGIDAGTVTVTAALDGISGEGTVTVTGARVVQLVITPPIIVTPAGGDVRLRASAVFSNDDAVDVTTEAIWFSENEQVAEIRQVGDSIRLEAVSAGVTTIRATYGGVTVTASVTVTPAVLESLAVTPAVLSLPAGNARQLILVGTYSDASRSNLTFQAEWSTSDGDIVVVGNQDQAGVVTGRAPGRATVTARIDNQSIQVAVTVTDAELVAIQVQPGRATVPAGDQVSLTCFGVYSDNSLRGLTEDAAWSSDTPQTAQVSNAPGERGNVTGVALGAAVIRARFEGFEDTGRVEVTEEEVVSVFVLPGQGLIVAGRSQNFNAFATYTNGSTQVVTQEAVWTSNRSAVAQVSNADNTRGRVAGIEPGQATITAAFGGESGQVNVRVSDAELEQLRLFPERVELSPGTSEQLFAVGIYSNRQVQQNLTFEALWTSDNPEVATVSNIPQQPGIVTGVSPGEATISAEVDGVRESITVVVVRRNVVGISISPPSAILPVDAFQNFTALAEYDDGTTQDVTQNATWGSSDASVIAPLQFRPGLTNTLQEGEATLTAEFDGFTGSASVVVRDAEPTNVVLSPVNPILRRQGNQPAQVSFYATAIYADNSTSDVTQLCTWSSSSPSTILIFDELGFKGRAFGLGTGSSEITAHCGEFSASTVATVR
jgi:trimeric autotransporter adhesin